MSQIATGYYWLGFALLVLYWIVAVGVIVAEDREPAITLSWILILTLLPVVGLPIYYFVGRDWRKIHARQPWVAQLRGLREPFMERVYARYAASSGCSSARITSPGPPGNSRSPPR